MEKVIEVTEAAGEGLESILGEKILLFCLNYIYTGKLVGVNEFFVQLEEPAIVYETGPFSELGYKDAQKLHTNVWYVQRGAIESFGLSK